MKLKYQREEELARGKRVSVGIDVHKESWHVTALVEGEEVFNGRLPAEYRALDLLFKRFKDCLIKVAYEAGPCGFSLYDQLKGNGIETLVVPPSLIPIESGNKVKTDKRDSRKLASFLQKDMLKKVHVLSQEDRADRELLRTRRQVVNHRSNIARQIKSKLLFYGIKPPFAATQTITQRYIKWLRTATDGQLSVSFEVLINTYEFMTEQIKKLNEETAELSRSQKYSERIKLLQSIPGIGQLSAMEILVELQDVRRFNSAKEIASYIGLTPSEYSTGQYIRQGRITRCGNKRIRSSLVESSWILISRDLDMRARYMKLKARRGGKRAIVAIARSLIIRIRKVLISGQPYKIASAI